MLTSSIAIVTGAGRGIGASIAKKFAKEGAAVVVNDLDRGPADEVVNEIVDKGGKAMSFVGSVVDSDFPERLVDFTKDNFGSPTILCNNAGYTWDGMLHKMSDEQWNAIMECHATAPFRCVRAVGRVMREDAKKEIEDNGAPLTDRCIVNISSISGLHGNVGQANYATGKAGIVGLTKTAAKEWGSLGIRSNCVAFGFIDTRMTRTSERGDSVNIGDGRDIPQGMPEAVVKQMTHPDMLRMNIPLGRLGQSEEAANGVLLMASPMASYITGHVLEVTGGQGI